MTSDNVMLRSYLAGLGSNIQYDTLGGLFGLSYCLLLVFDNGNKGKLLKLLTVFARKAANSQMYFGSLWLDIFPFITHIGGII